MFGVLDRELGICNCLSFLLDNTVKLLELIIESGQLSELSFQFSFNLVVGSLGRIRIVNSIPNASFRHT